MESSKNPCLPKDRQIGCWMQQRNRFGTEHFSCVKVPRVCKFALTEEIFVCPHPRISLDSTEWVSPCTCKKTRLCHTVRAGDLTGRNVRTISKNVG